MFLPIPLEFKCAGTKTKIPAANVALVVVNVLVYLFGWDWPAGAGTGPSSILLYGFCHVGLWHLALNMWVLWVFGNPVNRRLGNGLYLLVYLGCLLAVGLFARLILPVGLMGSSGAVFAVITIALILMPAAVIEIAYVALFPLTLLLGLFSRPKYALNWVLSWGIVAAPAWWCLVLIPLMELCSVLWRAFCFGWISSWTPGGASAGHPLRPGRRPHASAANYRPFHAVAHLKMRRTVFPNKQTEEKENPHGSVHANFRHHLGQFERPDRRLRGSGADARSKPFARWKRRFPR